MDKKSVEKIIESYPEQARRYARRIRELIYETATVENTEIIEETLKWGEPSFKAVHGTPIRMDWKEESPDSFHIFFNCQTTVVETCRVLYGSLLTFVGSREVILDLGKEPPLDILRHCFALALNYHQLKNKPLLGA